MLNRNLVSFDSFTNTNCQDDNWLLWVWMVALVKTGEIRSQQATIDYKTPTIDYNTPTIDYNTPTKDYKKIPSINCTKTVRRL